MVPLGIVIASSTTASVPSHMSRPASNYLEAGGMLSTAEAEDDESESPSLSPRHQRRRPSSSSNISQGMDYLNTVRTVKMIQRRDFLLKSKSTRSVYSTATVSSGGDGGDMHHAIFTETSYLLKQKSKGCGYGDDDDEENGAELVPNMVGEPCKERHNNNIDEMDDLMSLPPLTTKQAIERIIFGKGLVSACLLAGPLALYAVHAAWSPTWIFWLSFTVMIPLASILSDFTEEASLHTNETVGGLLNASFGNAVEVLVAVQALLNNEIRVVQASMLGSILSNLLLVLGCCFFFGGLYHKEQRFNATAASSNMGLLALSSIALILPAPYAEYYNVHDELVLKVSRVAAIFLIFMYLQLLVFQLKTHSYLFGKDDGDSVGGGGGGGESESTTMSFAVSVLGLLGTTLLVTIFSESLVKSIDGFTEASGISRTFVGLIILPIVGNAVEHMSAVTVAMKDKMDLSMGIAVGSSTQISLFVVPVTVLVGWALDKPMTLNFPHFEVILYIMAVMTVSIVTSNPRCNWLCGSLLITTYFLIAVGFWFEEVQDF